SFDHRQPFGGCLITSPNGPVKLNCRLGLSAGLFTGLPSNHGPSGSLSGFLKCLRFSGSSWKYGVQDADRPNTSIWLWSSENVFALLLLLSVVLQTTSAINALLPNTSSITTLA